MIPNAAVECISDGSVHIKNTLTGSITQEKADVVIRTNNRMQNSENDHEFKGSKPFSNINKILENNNKEKILW